MPILQILKALPFVKGLLTFFTEKTRLAVEYFLIAVAIAISCWSLNLYIKQQKGLRAAKEMQVALEDSQKRLSAQEMISTQQQSMIGFLQQQRKKDSEAITGIVKDLKTSRSIDTAARTKLRLLEKENERVRNYLDSDVPPDLECLLNETCASDASGNQLRKSKAPARTDEGL